MNSGSPETMPNRRRAALTCVNMPVRLLRYCGAQCTGPQRHGYPATGAVGTLERKRDYYEVLGVPRDADRKTIKDAFRRLALKYHPDRNKDHGAEETFKQIAEAYAVLSDAHRRADYDARGHVGTAGTTPEDLFGGIDFGDVLGGLGLDFGHDIFGRFFGQRRRGPRKGANVEVDIAVSLKRVMSGGEQIVRFQRVQPCPACDGSGAEAGTKPRQCATCGGSGEKIRHEQRAQVSIRQITTCPDCGGRGVLIDAPCRECGGQGQASRAVRLKVTIPAGIEDGTVLRVPGFGMASAEPAGDPGDLLVAVHTAPDPRFERRGADLWRIETIDIADAVLGTHIMVPTLHGHADTVVPPGTQPNAVLRLRGEGLPRFGGDGRGDILVRIQVRVPDKLTARERDIYERLRAGSRSRAAPRPRKTKTKAAKGA